MPKFILAALAVLTLLATPALAAPIGNQTTMTYDPGHGTQVEYVAADGTNYLWYPGNRVVLPGHWKVDGENICFAYGANTYNPVTHTRGGDFECWPTAAYLGTIVERAPGDVFGLKGRKAVPFALTKARTTIAALKGGKQTTPAAKPRDVSPASVPEGRSLYAVAVDTPPGKIPALCDAIIARQDHSKIAMQDAAHLYLHGMIMGVHCVKVDYARGVELLRKSGDKSGYDAELARLRDMAKSGNLLAESALRKLGIAG
jgi:hypothetical protein